MNDLFIYRTMIIAFLVTVVVSLSACGGGSDGGVNPEEVITDQPTLVNININNTTISEGDSNTSEMIFTLSLDTQAISDITIDYATRDDSATADVDYTPTDGTLTITTGSNSATISVPVIGDTEVENDETFTLILSNPSGATLLTTNAVGTIIDDDLHLSLTLLFPNPTRIVEGNSGTTIVNFPVKLSGGIPTKDITVDYATVDDTATAGNDYASATGTLTFSAGGPAELVIPVTVFGDTDNELDERFFMEISNAVGADISTSSKISVAIKDDDRPNLSISNTTIFEGDADTTDMLFAVTIDKISSVDVVINYIIIPGTAAGDDIIFNQSQTITILKGETTANISIKIIGDTIPELDESFTVGLRSGLTYTFADISISSAIGTILNDDQPVVSIGSSSVFEGTTQAGKLAFPVTLDLPISYDVVLDYGLGDTNNTATAGEDYVASAGSVTIAAGTTSKLLVVELVNDNLVELDETITISLNTVSPNALIGTATAIGVIENDDSDFVIPNRIHLPSTGMKSCFSELGTEIDCAGSGQDGELQIGAPWLNIHFSNNGDGTTTSLMTGLMWAIDGNLMPARDPGWDNDDQDDGLVTWQHALDYIAKLNSDSYLNYQDWRLPNRNELRSLANYGVTNNIPSLISNGFQNIKSAYWTSSADTTFTDYVWSINLTDGYTFFTDKSNPVVGLQYLIPVRSGLDNAQTALPQTGLTQCFGLTNVCLGSGQDGELQHGVVWPIPRFTTNIDSSQTDQLTGLIWPTNANMMYTHDPDWDNDGTNNGAVNWQHALDYIRKLNLESYLGHNDWRLPNINEMQSLINLNGVTRNWLLQNGFNNISDFYWTSNSRFALPNYAWLIQLGYGPNLTNGGSMPAGEKKRSFNVLPVRGGL